jgi:hypothetical protein
LTHNTFRNYIGNKAIHRPSTNIPTSDRKSDYSLPSTPQTLEEALSGPDREHWIEALRKEIREILTRKTFSYVPNNKLPKNRKAVKSKLAFRVTREPDGSIKYKVRWVACGYSQVPGRDYDATYSPCAQAKTFFMLLNLAAVHNWSISGLDVGNAYLEANIDKEIYMSLPKELAPHTTYVQLHKSLYGLKQAGELWNKLLNSVILSDPDFQRCANDVCLYVKRTEYELLILLTHVDDILIISPSDITISNFKEFMKKKFVKIKDLGDAISRYLSIDITQSKSTENSIPKVIINQKEYMLKVTSKNAPTNNMKSIPADPAINLRLTPAGEAPPTYDLVGEGRFLGDRTRPDILLALSHLGSNMTKPSIIHHREAIRLFEYLNYTSDLSLNFGGDSIDLFAFSDASYSPEGDSKSQLGYTIFLNKYSGAFLSKSKKATTVADSSAMSEIQALHLCLNEILWVRSILKELGFIITHPTPIYIDNKAAEDLCNVYSNSEKTKHINMRINKIRESIYLGDIHLIHIDTKNNIADIFTKPLARPQFEKLRDPLLNGLYQCNFSIPNPYSASILSQTKALYSKLNIY